MSFDLVIWAGELPTSDREARLFLDSHGMEDEPPDPRVLACKREITRKYTDGAWTSMIFGSIWASAPLVVQGPVLYMNLRWDVRDDVLDFIARTAAKHGLVCYDPQSSRAISADDLAVLRNSHAVEYRRFQDIVGHITGRR